MSDRIATAPASFGERQLGRGPAIALLAAILVLAAAVRFWRLGWGLDQRMSFPDERAFWESYLFAFSPPRWGSLFGHSLYYPTFYGYLSGAAVALAGALHFLAPSPDVFTALFVARAVAACAGLVTIVVVGLLGARGYGRDVAVVAAAIMAAVPFEAIQTHYASVDVLLGTTTALTLLASVVFLRERRASYAALSGACAALGFCTKYNAGVFVAVPAWVVLEDLWRERSLRRFVKLGGALLAGFLVTTVVVCPPWIFETAAVLRQLRWIRYQATNGGWLPEGNHVSATLGWYGRPYLYQLVAALPFVLGWPIYLASLLGVLYALRRRAPVDRVLLVSLAVYFVLLGQTTASFPRYLMPLFPALAVLGARALLALPLRGASRGALCVAIVAYGFALGFSQVDRFSYDQQFALADWLRRAFPRALYPIVRVAVPGAMQSYYGLRLPLNRIGIEHVPASTGHWLEARPEAFVLPEWLATSIRRDRNDPALQAELDRLESGTAGYHDVGRWRSTYLQESFYTWLDPAFASDLYVGEIGLRLYLRDDLLTAPPARAADPR